MQKYVFDAKSTVYVKILKEFLMIVKIYISSYNDSQNLYIFVKKKNQYKRIKLELEHTSNISVSTCCRV